MFCDACEDDICCADINELECSCRRRENLKPYDKCCYACELRGDTEACANPCDFQKPIK